MLRTLVACRVLSEYHPVGARSVVAAVFFARSDLLRKTSRQVEGAVASHIRHRHKPHKWEALGDESLETVANRFSDTFFSVWVVLKMPFRSFADLLFDSLALVPEKFSENYTGMAMAPPHFWRDEAAVRAELELQAMRDNVCRAAWL
eukprot:3582990-Amphidinium_carterae.2